MQKYRTLAPTMILRGRIKLDEKIAARHHLNLKKIKGAAYEVIGRVQLKAGIEFEYEGEEGRAFFETLQIIESVTEKAEA